MSKTPKKPKQGEVRIIGGAYRGRKLHFPSLQDLRPTPNRVRETLFNWLTTVIHGASCLDMFAGSGALAFEAMSRGAKYSLLVDSSAQVVQTLRENQSLLGFTNVDIRQLTFPYPKNLAVCRFNIVFVDPPFHKGYVPLALDWLMHCECLEKNCLVYVESEANEDVLASLSHDWELLKDKTASQVRYSLLRWVACAKYEQET